MSMLFAFRDLFMNPTDILKEAGVKPGYRVLDYGCGPGSYSIAAARMVTDTGTVHSLDIHPLALEYISKKARNKNISNIKTINSDCATGLSDESIDIILLYDILHDLSRPQEILTELHRVLKPEGVLSISDHHLKDDVIKATVTDPGLFSLIKRGEKVYNFNKIPTAGK